MDLAMPKVTQASSLSSKFKAEQENKIDIPAQRTVRFSVGMCCGCGCGNYYFERVVDFNSPMKDGDHLDSGDLLDSDTQISKLNYQTHVGTN